MSRKIKHKKQKPFMFSLTGQMATPGFQENFKGKIGGCMGSNVFFPLAGRRPSITSFILAKKREENPISRPVFRPTKF